MKTIHNTFYKRIVILILEFSLKNSPAQSTKGNDSKSNWSTQFHRPKISKYLLLPKQKHTPVSKNLRKVETKSKNSPLFQRKWIFLRQRLCGKQSEVQSLPHISTANKTSLSSNPLF